MPTSLSLSFRRSPVLHLRFRHHFCPGHADLAGCGLQLDFLDLGVLRRHYVNVTGVCVDSPLAMGLTVFHRYDAVTLRHYPTATGVDDQWRKSPINSPCLVSGCEAQPDQLACLEDAWIGLDGMNNREGSPLAFMP